jgi:GrpB-like predicted nucleotidyltransferase (UPF0157 family)
MSEPITVVDYDPAWPITFARLKSELEGPLGGLAVEIEHVGSTSIPSAAAKPIIDIDVVLRSTDEVQLAILLLERKGYHHQGNLGIPGREAFESPPSLPPHHLYVVVVGNSEHTRHLQFRNYLREHPETTERYSDLKKTLATKFRNDRAAYTEGKTAFIMKILSRRRRGRPTRISF